MPQAFADGRLPAPVVRELRQVGIPATSVAVYVQEAGKLRPVLAHRAQEAMNPASLMKLVTTYAALELLGPAYTWKTEIYAAAPVKDGALDGDLFIKGYGDPSLTLENFWLLLRELRARGVRDIRGDLVLDQRYFEAGGSDPGAFDGEPHRPYNAAPQALLVNFNAIRFRFSPGPGGVAIQADPRPPQLKIVNQVKLSGGTCNGWQDGIVPDVRPAQEGVALTLSGSYPASCGEKDMNLAVLEPAAYIHGVFKQLWEESGGALRGKVRLGEVPKGARLLVVRESRPLAEAVRDINKFSNNVMARQLFLTIGAVQSGAPGTLPNAAAAVSDWLAAKGLAFPELALENGCGLSRIERISAEHLGRLLLAAYQSPMFAELESSLPIVSVDGTMQKRLKERGVAGHAHIKTGSLEGVKSIAGYVFDRKGRRMAVVFLINHPKAALGKAAQDALLEWVHNRL